MPELRVHAFTRTVPAPRGYVGHVKISMGCYGDTGGWISKFTAFGDFGRDGTIRPMQ
jgi:hypothetical protein